MKYKILVVDDNRLILALIKGIFENECQDYAIFTAANGQEACDLAYEILPNLIVMDLEMPLMNGLEAMQELKRYEKTSNIPVIIVTATPNLRAAFEAGAIDFIRKPIDKTELILRVKSTLTIFQLLKEITEQTEKLEFQSQELEKQKQILQEEKQKSEKLLLNVLPQEIADQLKNKGAVLPKFYKKASVLFTDFKGFTKISEILSPVEIVKELNFYFEKFDEIIEKHFIEKIKTIGDSYMCAGGIPLRNNSNPFDTVLAGLQMQHFVSEWNDRKKQQNLPIWELRIGIHTGNVISGVIGKKKFAYDIWGDTVNTASRMESAGASGRVNVSKSTYEYIKDFFDCEYRGKIEVKNKGEIEMYFVNGLKNEYSKDLLGLMPNKKFIEILSEF